MEDFAKIRKERELKHNLSLLAEGGLFHKEYTVEDGIARWNSNGHVPPADMIEAMIWYGEELDEEACAAARDADFARFVQGYREAQKNMSAEERRERDFERRAAFGPGETVVDILTGETFRT